MLFLNVGCRDRIVYGDLDAAGYNVLCNLYGGRCFYNVCIWLVTSAKYGHPSVAVTVRHSHVGYEFNMLPVNLVCCCREIKLASMHLASQEKCLVIPRKTWAAETHCSL